MRAKAVQRQFFRFMERGTKALFVLLLECYGGSASQNRKGHGINHTELTRFARRRGDVRIPRSVIFLPREANEKKAEKISWKQEKRHRTVTWPLSKQLARELEVAHCLERWIHCTYGFDY